MKSSCSGLTWEIKTYIISSLKHKNIVESYGICVDATENNRIWLIMEYMEMTLKEIMGKLKNTEKLKAAIAVAKAM